MKIFNLRQYFKGLDVHLQEVVHGTFIAFIFRCLGAVLALAFQVALVRVLGAEDAGRYILSVSCVLFISVIGRMGLDVIVVRQIASHASVGEWTSVDSIRRKSLKVVFIVTVALSLGLLFGADYIAQVIFKDQAIRVLLQVMSIAAPFWAVAALQSEMLRGLRRIGQYLFIQSVMMAIITLVGVLIFGTRFGLLGQAILYILATSFSMLAAMGLWQFDRIQSKECGEEIAFLNLLRSSLPVLWMACIQYLNTWIATLILGAYGDPAKVAMFNSVSRLALAPSFLLVSANSILGPKFSSIYKAGTCEVLERVTAQTTRILLIAVLPVMVLFMLFPSFFLGLFGQEFKSASSILRVLVLGQIIIFMTGFAGQLLLMTGHEKDLRNVTTIYVVFNIVLSYLLVHLFQVLGAAWATVISSAVNSMVLVFVVRKKIGISAHIFSKKQSRC